MANGKTSPGNGPLLVLCGVSPRLQVVCGRPGGPVAWRMAGARGQSAEVLAPLVAEVLGEAGCAPTELGGIACVRGPGSFTGIRVVLATGFGLSFGAGVPLAGLEFLPLLAASAAKGATGAIVAVTHARAGQVYVQSFLADGDLMPMGPPVAATVAEACAKVADGAAVGPLVLVGDGVARYRQAFLAAAPLAAIPGPVADDPDPLTFLTAAASATYGLGPLSPLYLRLSDAEDNLASLAALRGLSLEAAQERLRLASADD